MSKAIMASIIVFCIGWWFTTYCVITGWALYGLAALLKTAARGGAFD